jgi:hypothetical protein
LLLVGVGDRDGDGDGEAEGAAGCGGAPGWLHVLTLRSYLGCDR